MNEKTNENFLLHRKQIGEKLKSLRNKNGHKITTVAAGIGVSASVISKIENGNYNIALYHLDTLADFYQINVMELFS